MVVAGMAGVLAVVVWAVVAPDAVAGAGDAGLGWTIRTFGWFFVLAADAFLVLALVIAAGRFGRVRLGADDERPEFTTLAWVAMMFSAGMGIGLVFYGVAEPIQHYASPPPASGAVAGTPHAASVAMQYTLFHWTLHPWAIYAVAGLALAYSTFRRGRGNLLSAAFRPLLGDRADGAAGRIIDLVAVFATVFGSATSLGIGALQVAAGLDIVAGIPDTRTVEVVIVASLIGAFLVSAMSGLDRGVKWLSTINVWLTVLLLVFVFALGPTIYALEVLPASIGDYLNSLLVMSTRTGAFSDPSWMGAWTLFYWAWWISWAPFVGTFIARISRGRTVRQFVVGVLLIPSGASAVWFAVLGGSALRTQITGTADIVADVAEGAENGLFGLLDALPAATVTTALAVLLVALYFITSADSASLVLASLTSRGALHPARPLVVAWGVLIGAIGATLLLAGGLQALQQATVVIALPFSAIMLLLAVALMKDLVAEERRLDQLGRG
ncbi:BCCT family transporter [Actinoplanes sp. NPDC048796]|uniref:BCCT family transporter n=1 Tax=Actinoplanes sp. NPDC048796 TaxID=3155640 RepID=UPI0033C46AB6